MPKHVSTVVIFFAFGSHICIWRLFCAIGTSFADGWLEPSRQNAAVSDPRMRAATQTRACLSIAKLCETDWLFQITSSPQYAEGAAGGWSAALGVFGSRTTSATCVAELSAGFTTGRNCVLSSVAP